MCLTVNKRWKSLESAKKSSIPVAKEDIVVYKVLQKRLNLSLYQGAKYEKGKLHISSLLRYFGLSFHDGGYICNIKEGLHSYTNIKRAKSNVYYISGGYKVVKMIIPKGSKYYIGTCEDIVSNKLYWPKK